MATEKPEPRRPILPQRPSNPPRAMDIAPPKMQAKAAHRPNESTGRENRPAPAAAPPNPPRNPDETSLRNRPAGALPRGGGAGLAGILQSVIGGMESGTKIRESLALAYWPRIAGPQAAAATEPEMVRDGILFVRTKSSTWSHELTLHKARLLLGLNRMLGGKLISDIIFRAQGVSKSTEQEESGTPAPEELAAVVLEPPEKSELRARLQDLYVLEDDRIRHTIAARLVQEAKLRHWRLERGWRVCPRCAAVHKTDFAVCPICRLCG